MNANRIDSPLSAPSYPNGFSPVTRDEFFRVIGPQNVTPYPRGRYPYVSEWTTQAGTLRGWSYEGVYALPFSPQALSKE
jgi:hypothetical protein